MGIGKKLGIGFGAMGATAALMTAVALVNIGTLGGLFEKAASADVVKLDLAQSVDVAIADIVSFERGELNRARIHDLKTVDTYHETASQSARQAAELLARLQPLLITADGKRNVAEIGAALETISAGENKM